MLLIAVIWISMGSRAMVGAGPTDSCPADQDSAQIEVLVTPFTDQRNTCVGFTDSATMYLGGTCRLPGVSYTGPDAIYKVFLHEGNNVAFSLQVDQQVEKPADLVLALVRDCGKTQSTCESNSPDFIGPQDEVIPSRRYDPGIYYLFVDSAGDSEGRCGAYKLTVTGVNPTPDLLVSLTGSPDPVKAGEDLTYTLSVTNKAGTLDATGVEVTLTLPAGVNFLRADSGCEKLSETKIRCSVGNLADGSSSRPWKISVRVDPAARGEQAGQAERRVLRSTAKARANEGDPTPLDNEKTLATEVIARSDLSIEKNDSIDPVIAGTSLTYTLQVRNAGPSDANQVEVTDELLLKGNATLLKPANCAGGGSLVTCIIPKIKAGKSAVLKLTAEVAASAKADSSLVNQARVALTLADEKDLDEKNNTFTRTTEVDRETNLSITKTGPALKNAGELLTYDVAISNDGPSDSDTAKVSDKLPARISFTSQIKGCGAGDDTFRSVTCGTTCPVGRLVPGGCKVLRFEGRIPSSQPSATFSNDAEVQVVEAEERDPDLSNNKSQAVLTSVKVKADLSVVKEMQRVPGFACDAIPTPNAGENLLYTVTVENGGPSDSRSTVITDKIDPRLTFISSPDGCSESSGTVTCPLESLAPGEEPARARYVVAVDPNTSEIKQNEAKVAGEDDSGEEHVSNFPLPDPLQLGQASDLAVTLTDSSDPVLVGGELVYILKVTNSGPADTASVAVNLELPQGTSCLASDCGCPGPDGIVHCVLDVAVGTTVARRVHIRAPSSLDGSPVTAKVAMDFAADCRFENNTAEATTTLAMLTNADLAVTKTAAAEAAVVGGLIRYALAVTNNGPADATGVKVQDALPAGLTFVSAAGCDYNRDERVVTCSLDALPKRTEKRLCLNLKVNSGLTDDLLMNTATVAADPDNDPNPDNDTAQPVETPVLQLSPLILPFFEVDKAASETEGVTTLLAVKNPSEQPVGIRYTFAPAGEQVNACVVSKGIDTRNLRDITPLLGHTGHVEIRPVALDECPLADPPPSLVGDFIRIDPSQRTAGGEALVSTDSEQCQSWSVRFLNGGPLIASTEFLFFASGNDSGADKGLVTGRVYNETGQFVQEISVDSAEKAFRRTTLDTFDNAWPLLAGSGSIEWTFRKGIVGNMSSVHKAKDNDLIAMPGFCRRPPSEGCPNPASSPLIVPYFEIASVDSPDLSHVTTLFAVRNETEAPVQVNYSYFDSDGDLLFDDKIDLTGHATNTVNLRDLRDKLGTNATGYIVVDLVDAGIPLEANVLSGDYLYVDRDRHLASGSALPSRLCRRWDARFMQRPSRSTDFIFHLPAKSGATGVAYDTDGAPIGSVTVPSGQAALKVSAADLPLSGEGSVEWDLGKDTKGYVTVLFREDNRFAVLVPGKCRDDGQ